MRSEWYADLIQQRKYAGSLELHRGDGGRPKNVVSSFGSDPFVMHREDSRAAVDDIEEVRAKNVLGNESLRKLGKGTTKWKQPKLQGEGRRS